MTCLYYAVMPFFHHPYFNMKWFDRKRHRRRHNMPGLLTLPAFAGDCSQVIDGFIVLRRRHRRRATVHLILLI